MDDYGISDAELPTMVIRCNNTLVLRSVITGQHLELLGPTPNWAEGNLPKAMLEKSEQIEKEYIKALEAIISLIPYEEQVKVPTTKLSTAPKEHYKSPNNDAELPPCKVQRNYCCTLCSYYTQNPRSHLLHQRDVHGIRLSIHSCQHCQYASRYFQKLKRHIKMVHTVRSSQETLTKTETQRDANPTDMRDSGTKLFGFNINSEIVTPLSEQNPIEPSGDLPCCSKDIKALPDLVNIKNDPEAFFVAAYKKQLQKQLEYEKRLKNFVKAFSDEPSNLATPCGTSKPLISVNNTIKDQLNVTEKLPYHITEENSNFPTEHEKKRMFSCRKCNYVTHIKSRYNKHVKYHSMPMIQCDKCEFRTTYKWNLTRHLRSHHGNGIYKCSVCSFSAHMKQSLTSHEVNHHSPPVGRAGSKKPIRRRRCRVGGSDLQPETSQQKSSNTSNEPITNDLNREYNINQEGLDTDNGDAREGETLNSTPSSSNETEQCRSQGSVNYPMSSDTENSFYSGDESDYKTSIGSDIESDCFPDKNSSEKNQTNPTNEPVHVDADYLSDAVEIGSSHRSSELSLNNITSQESEINTGSNSNPKNLEIITGENVGYNSDSSLSTSTISADEGFEKSLEPEFDSSFQSSCDSEDDSSSSSSTISSDVSIDKTSRKSDVDNNENEKE